MAVKKRLAYTLITVFGLSVSGCSLLELSLERMYNSVEPKIEFNYNEFNTGEEREPVGKYPDKGYHEISPLFEVKF